MRFKKTVCFLVALCVAVSLFQVCFAVSYDDRVFIGQGQYLEIGEDMRGFVDPDTLATDPNPVPSDAKYTNGFYTQGAQVRVSGDKAGLRFVIVNNVNVLSLLKQSGIDDITYGALVQYNTLEPLTFKNSVKVSAQNIFKTTQDLNADFQKFTVCVTNIPTEHLKTVISVRPFLSYVDLDGNEQTLFGEQYSSDIYAMAYLAYNGDEEQISVKEYLFDSIISPCKDAQGKVLSDTDYPVTDEFIKLWRDKTDKRIKEIRSTPNMEIPSGKRVFYVSNSGSDTNDGTTPQTAWATLNCVSNADLYEGDFVLFERGGYFRGQLIAQSGVTYSAYGEGDKPIIVRSPEDGANKNKWVKVQENIWEYQTPFNLDVGTLVFNHGEAHAVKWLVFKNESGVLEEYRTKVKWDGVSTIKTDLEFWHSTENKKIYLCSEENPGERFDSIEFLIREHAIKGASDATFDNLTIKYTGAHGIAGGSKNLTVQNCTFEWIGGSIQYVDYSRKAPTPVRFGNGVEIYGGCNGFTVDNCYFNQIYDAAVTHQYSFDVGSTSQEDKGHYNVTFKNNVMENCVYSIEYFLGRLPAGNTSYMGDILYENNLMWYAGQGLGSQRPNNTSPAHIKGWGHINPVKNFVIKNNFMAYSTSMLIHTNFKNMLPNNEVGVKFIDNIVVGEYGQSFGMFGYATHDVKTDYLYGMHDYMKRFSSGNRFYYYHE